MPRCTFLMDFCALCVIVFTLKVSIRQMKSNSLARCKFQFVISFISNWFCLRLRTATTSGTRPTPAVLISAGNCLTKLNNVKQFASHRETVVHIQRVASGMSDTEARRGQKRGQTYKYRPESIVGNFLPQPQDWKNGRRWETFFPVSWL